jgi:hypothetical protein
MAGHVRPIRRTGLGPVQSQLRQAAWASSTAVLSVQEAEWTLYVLACRSPLLHSS